MPRDSMAELCLFNIQIVICHPPHAGIVSPVSPPSAGLLLSPATSDYEHLELTGKSQNKAGHVVQVHVSPVQRVTTHNTPQPDQVTPS